MPAFRLLLCSCIIFLSSAFAVSYYEIPGQVDKDPEQFTTKKVAKSQDSDVRSLFHEENKVEKPSEELEVQRSSLQETQEPASSEVKSEETNVDTQDELDSARVVDQKKTEKSNEDLEAQQSSLQETQEPASSEVKSEETNVDTQDELDSARVVDQKKTEKSNEELDADTKKEKLDDKTTSAEKPRETSSPKSDTDKVASSSEVDVSHISKEISELKTMLANMSNSDQKEQEKLDEQVNEPKETPPLIDENFKLISATQDKLQSLFANRGSILTENYPTNLELALTVLKNFANSYGNVLSDKKVAEELVDGIDSSLEFLPNIMERLRKSVSILKMISLVASSGGLADDLSKLKHEKVISQTKIQAILESGFTSVREWLPDLERKLVNDVIAATMKASYDEKPNVPSHVVFNLFNILSKLTVENKKEIGSLGKKFSRNMDSLVQDLSKLTEDLNIAEKSENTAPSSVVYLSAMKKSIIDSVTSLKSVFKDWNVYITEVSSFVDEIIPLFNEVLDEKKDQEIFSHLENKN